MILTPKRNINSSSSLPECPPTPQGSEWPTLLQHASFPVLPFQFNAQGGDVQSTQSRPISDIINTSTASTLFKSIARNEEVSKDGDSTSFGWPKQRCAQIKGLQVSKIVLPKAA
eukprot:scaffold39440_cov63-Cyclotella_meneghiniana.AAC.5